MHLTLFQGSEQIITQFTGEPLQHRTGLTFYHRAEGIFKIAISYSDNSVDIVFDVYFEQSAKNIEKNWRYSGTVSFRKNVGSHVALQWNSFLDLNHNKTELVQFLVSKWEKKNITEKATQVTYDEKYCCLNYNQEIPALN